MATHPIRYPLLPMQSPTVTAPAHVASLIPAPPSNYELLSKLSSSHVATTKMVRILDPPIFHADPAKDTITYWDWHLQMRNKLQANGAHMPTEALKKSYVQSRVADNALAQLSTRLEEETTRLFATVKEMFDVLTAAFGDTNRKCDARMEYRLLRQGTRDFNTF